ncbi:hypothetical protein [Salinicola endophyticus]|uniref:Tail terminator n=1 Tax=Salinicola endophyticus TaxID=1949083 RepID=A0AB74UBR2_9GAMM
MNDDTDLTDALIARLREQCPDLVSVEEADTTDPLESFRDTTPCARVYYAEDGANDEPDAMGRRQSVSQIYGVWLVSRVGEDFRQQRKAIRDALFGWQPVPHGALMAYKGGKVDKIVGGYRLWLEFWSVDTIYRPASRTVTV